MRIGERLKQEQEKRKMTNEQFALFLGVNTSSIRNWTSNKYTPSKNNTIKIAEALGWSDEERIKYIIQKEEMAGVDPLITQALIRSHDFGMNQEDLAQVIGVAKSTISKWKQEGVTEAGKERLESFMDMSDDEIHERLAIFDQAKKPVRRGKAEKERINRERRELLKILNVKYDETGDWKHDDPYVERYREIVGA